MATLSAHYRSVSQSDLTGSYGTSGATDSYAVGMRRIGMSFLCGLVIESLHY